MNPSEFLSALGWRDMLDFSLLFLTFYAVLRIVRGTLALPVVIIVALIAASGQVARALQLVGVAQVITYFLQYAILILIVVFHQEIRRILVRAGQRLLPHGQQQAKESAVGELVDAVERLAKARVGSLIVLEGELDVLEFCTDAGRPIEASLKMDTLVALSVPHPANVAHDGAIVIRNFIIARTAVICPLTERPLDPRFGTRHRGAIGISEETDALVLVVSEERGETRAIHGGDISEPLDAAGVESRIHEWLEREVERESDGEEEAQGSRGNLPKEAVGEVVS